MKKNLSDYIVALAVIASSVALLAVLTFALSGWKKKSATRSLEADFPDVTGVRIHTQVRYAGALAGRVLEVRLLTPQERAAAPESRRGNAVRVSMELDESVPPLPEDARVFLASDTLLSEKFVAISAGTPGAGTLANGAVVQGMGSTSIDAVVEKIGPLVASLEPVLLSLQRTIDSVEPVLKKTGSAVDTFNEGIGDALPRVSKLADSLKTTSESADAALRRIDKLISENEGPIKEDLAMLKSALEQLDGTLKGADKLVGNADKMIDGRMKELSVVLQNLKVASTHAKAAFETLGENPSRLLWKGKPNQLPSEEEILRTSKPVPARKAATPAPRR